MGDLGNELIGVDVLDFDELERNDDEGLGGSGNGKKFRDTRAFVVDTILTPLRSPSQWRVFGSSSPLQRARGRSCPRSRSQRSREVSPRVQPQGNTGAYNLVARLGASSSRGGTRPECQSTRELDGSEHDE